MSIIRNFWRAVTGRRYLAGRDLKGNKYFEYPHTPGSGDLGRTKRQVKYLHEADSYPGFATLPIQWHSWLSHTRPTPPTLEELQADAARMQRLKANVLVIEARDREERARQLQKQALEAPSHHEAQAELSPPPGQAKPEPAADSPFKPFIPGSDQPTAWSPRTNIRRGD